MALKAKHNIVPNSDLKPMQEAKCHFGKCHILLVEEDGTVEVLRGGSEIPFQSFSGDSAFDFFEELWRMGQLDLT